MSHREGAASGTMGEQGPGKHAPPPKERPRSPMRRQATIRSQRRCALNAQNHGDRAATAQLGTSRGQQGVVGDPLKEPHANGRDGESWGYPAISISRGSSKRPVRGAAECEAARAATGRASVASVGITALARSASHQKVWKLRPRALGPEIAARESSDYREKNA